MSSIIVPDHLAARDATKRGHDFAQLRDVPPMVQQQIIAVYGPLASILEEVCARVQVIEDHLGIVAPGAEPKATLDTAGDVE